MGLGGIVSTVLTKYKADTSDQKKALKSLKGEELKRHKALLDQTEAQNKKIDDQIAFYGKLAVGLGAVTLAAGAMAKGFDDFAENAKLSAASAGVSMDGLKKASAGLVSELDLMRFAADSMNGTFKLSQKEMEGVLRGAIALRAQGKDLGKVMERLGQSTREGNVEPMKELGVVIGGVAGDSQEGLNALLKQMNEEAEKMAGRTGIAGDDVHRGVIETKDAFREMSVAIGELSASMAPLITKFAKLLQIAMSIPAGFNDLVDSIMGNETAESGRLAGSKVSHTTRAEHAFRQRAADLEREAREGMNSIARRSALLAEARELKRKADRIRDDLFAEEARVSKGAFGPPAPIQIDLGGSDDKKKGSGGFSLPGAVDSNQGDRQLELNEAPDVRLARINAEAEGRRYATQLLREQNAALVEQGELELKNFQVSQAMLADLQAQADSERVLTTIFGTPAEIDAQAEAIGRLGQTFGGFADAFGAGVGALIDGSKSFADAFKDALAGTLKSMAIEMSVRALRETAIGIATLAGPTPWKAAGHFNAAMAFGAGAVAAGAGARALGGGGGGAAAGSAPTGSAGVGAAGGGAGGKPEGHTNVFIVGNDFAGLPAGQRESQWREISRKAGVTVQGDAILDE